MTTLTVDTALEAIYTSLQNNNEDIDAHIASLKAALAAAGVKEAPIDNKRLAQPNRQGRKLLEAYFKKRGVAVAFENVA